ncbi:hypothetical protein GCM10023148_06490 [Actinokineospora soli]
MRQRPRLVAWLITPALVLTAAQPQPSPAAGEDLHAVTNELLPRQTARVEVPTRSLDETRTGAHPPVPPTYLDRTATTPAQNPLSLLEAAELAAQNANLHP